MHQVRAIILKEAYDQFYSVKIFFDGHLDSMEYPMPPPPLKGGGTFTPSLDIDKIDSLLKYIAARRAELRIFVKIPIECTSLQIE